jgi:NAD-dependent dihydropyrimidine dehydrogenase PreA subunit
MTEDESIYRQLQYEIDTRTSSAFPATDSGLEIRILKHLFTPLEAKIACHLSALPERLNRIYRRVKKNGIDISKDDLEKLLDGLVQKGAILYEQMLSYNPKHKTYSLVQFVVGFYELQADRLTREFYIDSENYLHEHLLPEFQHTREYRQMRTVPVNKSIEVDRYVTQYDNIRKLVEQERGPFAIMNCLCRDGKDLVGESCKLSDMRRVCITLGYSAKGSFELFPSADEISKEELLNLLDDFEKEGFVLQPENCHDPKFICVCCGCCCGALSYYNKLDRPVDHWISNYYAEIDPNLCNGCGVCADICQLYAISIENKLATIDLGRCFGCGNCVTKCKKNAITLYQKEKTIKPNRFHKGVFVNFFLKKRGFWGLLKMAIRYVFGLKV